MIRLNKQTRREQILAEALRVASVKGYNRITRDDIAEGLGIPASLVCYHLGPASRIREEVMREAVRVGCAPVIAQGLAMRDPLAVAVGPMRQLIRSFLGL